MRIILEEDPAWEEVEVTIRCKEVTPQVAGLVASLRRFDHRLTGEREGKTYLLEAGDLLSPCRRLLVMAAEDVGLAYPQAMAVTKACVDAARELGLPEARLPLAEAAILLATAPKSNSAHNAIIAAMDDIRRGRVGQVPRHLQNVHADSTGSGKAPAYKYPHDYPHHYVAQRYLPEALGDVTYYEYGDNKTEQAARRYWEDIKKN